MSDSIISMPISTLASWLTATDILKQHSPFGMSPYMVKHNVHTDSRWISHWVGSDSSSVVNDKAFTLWTIDLSNKRCKYRGNGSYISMVHSSIISVSLGLKKASHRNPSFLYCCNFLFMGNGNQRSPNYCITHTHQNEDTWTATLLEAYLSSTLASQITSTDILKQGVHSVHCAIWYSIICEGTRAVVGSPGKSTTI